MLDLAELDVKIENNNGKPLELLLVDVMEDPSQPRVEFPELEMNKIAESIKQRGVKTPISVHVHPTEIGKYIINHGARRYRGSLMAGKKTIPAFIDENHTDYDQVMENKERLGHTPIEIALFIKKKLDAGEKKGTIAKNLNEDAVYVTTHLALVDMPEALSKAYNAGCKSPKTLYDLRNLLEKHPEPVEAWILDMLDKGQEIYRSSVQALAKELKKPKKEETPQEEEINDAEIDKLKILQQNAEKLVSSKPTEPTPAVESNQAVNANESVLEGSLEESEPTPAVESNQAVNANESVLEESLEESEQTPAVESNQAVNANESVLEGSLEENEPTPAVESNQAVNANESKAIKLPEVRVIYDGQDAVLMLYKAPRSRGFAWIELVSSKKQIEVDCVLLEIESISEG